MSYDWPRIIPGCSEAELGFTGRSLNRVQLLFLGSAVSTPAWGPHRGARASCSLRHWKVKGSSAVSEQCAGSYWSLTPWRQNPHTSQYQLVLCPPSLVLHSTFPALLWSAPVLKQLHAEPQKRALLNSWGQVSEKLQEMRTSPFYGTDLDGTPGLMGEEVHRAGGAGLHWSSKQDIQLCGACLLVQEENLWVGEGHHTSLAGGSHKVTTQCDCCCSSTRTCPLSLTDKRRSELRVNLPWLV